MELLELLAPLTKYGAAPAYIFIGVIARISSLVFFLPGMGERFISMRVRLAAAMAISLILTPVVMANPPAAPQSAADLALIIAAEAIAGAIIGFAIRITVYAIQIAGSIAAQGMSLQQLFAGLEGAPEPPVSILLMFAAIAVAVAAGLHFDAVRALAVSYKFMPFGEFPGAADTGQWAAQRAAFAFSTALALAMPFVVLGFIYNLAIGAANRAMPQLMVAFVGAPAVSLAGMALLAISAPVILQTWRDILDKIIVALIGGSL